MKKLFIILAIFISCQQQKETVVENDTSTIKDSTPGSQAKPTSNNGVILVDTFLPKPIHSNTRFKDVHAERTGPTTFKVSGKAQVFEASISWVVEDGHNEIKSGHEMTSAGAPEWGSFEFTIDVAKKRENSTLTLILFESSAKDGSRQYELPIKLY